jgi:hypothetical protein
VARHIKLTELVPQPKEPDTIEFPDGKVFEMPRQLGIDTISNLLMIEEGLTDAEAFDQLREQKAKLLTLIAEANPGKKVPDYDMTVDQMMELIVVFVGGEGSATQTVRDALARETTEDEPASEEDARAEAAELGEAAGLREEDDEGPLASPTRSRKSSSRSATSATGDRSGGKGSAGRSSSRTSKKRSASKSG